MNSEILFRVTVTIHLGAFLLSSSRRRPAPPWDNTLNKNSKQRKVFGQNRPWNQLGWMKDFSQQNKRNYSVAQAWMTSTSPSLCLEEKAFMNLSSKKLICRLVYFTAANTAERANSETACMNMEILNHRISIETVLLKNCKPYSLSSLARNQRGTSWSRPTKSLTTRVVTTIRVKLSSRKLWIVQINWNRWRSFTRRSISRDQDTHWKRATSYTSRTNKKEMILSLIDLMKS